MQRTMHDEHGGTGFLMGLIWGAAIGAAVGLLFAPRPGADVRARVGDTASRMGRRAKDTYDRASNAVSEMRHRAEDVTARFRQRAAGTTERAADQVSQATGTTSRNRTES